MDQGLQEPAEELLHAKQPLLLQQMLAARAPADSRWNSSIPIM